MGMSNLSSPALILMRIGGQIVPVCGKTFQMALWAAALVDTVLRRGEEIPLPTSRTGGLIRVRVNNKTLCRFLLEVYSDDPGAVAEAIMTLRKLNPAKAAWLVRVLEINPELKTLAQTVNIELTGEEPDGNEAKAG